MKNYHLSFFTLFVLLFGTYGMAFAKEIIATPMLSGKNDPDFFAPLKPSEAKRTNKIFIGHTLFNTETPDSAVSTWAVAVSEFKLLGEHEVKNVKITWEQRKDADLYRVYRDRQLIGETKGDTFDDYGLRVGKTYTYYAEALKAGRKIATAIPDKATTFTPSDQGIIYDNSRGGNNLNLSGGIKIGNIYYSYPVKNATKEINGESTKGRAVYEKTSSTGLDNWSAERELAFYPNANFEGVNVAYNLKTRKVVIAAHFEDQGGYSAAKLYLAEITPNGALKPGFCGKPLGNDSRDQSMFIDDDGSAYILSATRINNDINVYKLNEAWTRPDSLINTLFIGQHRETPSIKKKDGVYYFFSSKASGWYPSQSMYASSVNLRGVWTSLKEIGNNSTYATQLENAGKFGKKKETYVLWGYHWGAQYRHKDPEGNYPRMFPATFNAGFAAMEYYPYVEYHQEYGIIPVQAGKNLTRGAKVTAPGADVSKNDLDLVTDGVDLNSSGYFKGASLPYSLIIDLNKKAKIAEIDLSTRLVGGSETAYKFTIEGSLDGKNYTKVFDGSNNWLVGFQMLKIADQSPYQYLRLNVKDVVNVQNEHSAAWADGIFELTAFGTPVTEADKVKHQP